MSRTRARKLVRGRALRDAMEARGILVRSASDRGLAEDDPDQAVRYVAERILLDRRAVGTATASRAD